MLGMKDTNKTTNFPDADPAAISIEAAIAHITARMPTFKQSESIPVQTSRGRILSADLISPMATPPFRASAMDGYAFRHADDGNTRRLIGESSAGHPAPDALTNGTCVRVFTGAKIPLEADTVVQQENATLEQNQLTIETMPKVGHHIRDLGSDCAKGSCIATSGTRINAGLIGLSTALGVRDVNVYKKIRVTIISSGDEICQSDKALQDGQIYDANAPLLNAILDDPTLEVQLGTHMLDTPDSVNHALNECSNNDVVITTGGVSVGSHDHLRAVMEVRGGVTLWKVAMKPGRPLSFGLLDGEVPWFGLPGNPVSAALTTLLFVIPALRYSQGLPNPPLRVLSAKCENCLTKIAGRVEFQRGILSTDDTGRFNVTTTGLQDSHVLTSLATANCFIRLPIESTGIKSGESVDVIPYEFMPGSID